MAFNPDEFLKNYKPAEAAPFDPDEFLKTNTRKLTPFTGSASSSIESLKGDIAALKGKVGLEDIAKAEAEQKRHQAISSGVYTPTEKGWMEAPGSKLAELAGGSLPYMVAPVVAAGAAAALPEAAGLGVLSAADLAAGAASGVQFTGSNLSRQMQEGKSLQDASLANAAAAAIPQAALDVVGLHMIPGLRGLLGHEGAHLTEEQLAELAKRSLTQKAVDFTLKTGKVMGAEGLTEAGQQVFERLQAGLNIADPDARKEYLDNFIGGAVLGGAMSVPGHIYEGLGNKPQEEPPSAGAQPVTPPPAGGPTGGQVPPNMGAGTPPPGGPTGEPPLYKVPTPPELAAPEQPGLPPPPRALTSEPELVEPSTEGLAPIPFQTVKYDTGAPGNKRYEEGQAPIIDYSGRKIVMQNVNGVQVPFYLSTGTGGKTDVPAGKWYPFFGIGSDGWINKTGGKEMANYYGSDELRQAGEQLDTSIGDIRNDNKIPKVSSTGAHIDFINQGLTPTENKTKDTITNVRQNIDNVLARINKQNAPVTSVTGEKKVEPKEVAKELPPGFEHYEEKMPDGTMRTGIRRIEEPIEEEPVKKPNVAEDWNHIVDSLHGYSNVPNVKFEDLTPALQEKITAVHNKDGEFHPRNIGQFIPEIEQHLEGQKAVEQLVTPEEQPAQEITPELTAEEKTQAQKNQERERNKRLKKIDISKISATAYFNGLISAINNSPVAEMESLHPEEARPALDIMQDNELISINQNNRIKILPKGQRFLDELGTRKNDRLSTDVFDKDTNAVFSKYISQLVKKKEEPAEAASAKVAPVEKELTEEAAASDDYIVSGETLKTASGRIVTAPEFTGMAPDDTAKLLNDWHKEQALIEVKGNKTLTKAIKDINTSKMTTADEDMLAMAVWGKKQVSAKNRVKEEAPKLVDKEAEKAAKIVANLKRQREQSIRTELKAAAQDKFDKSFPKHKEMLKAWLPDFGWATEGGKIIRDPDTGEVVGRTSWEAKNEYLDGVRVSLNRSFNQIKESVEKALDGKKLSPLQLDDVNAVMDLFDELTQEFSTELTEDEINELLQIASYEENEAYIENSIYSAPAEEEVTPAGAETQALELKGETKEEIAAKEKAIEIEANLKRQAEQKAKAAEAAGEFTLTGSNREADIAAAKGAQDLFAKTELEHNYDKLKENTVTFSSGLTSISDLESGAKAKKGNKLSGIGIDIGELSSNGLKKLAQAILDGVRVFIDSGAFSTFRSNLKREEDKTLNFDEILKKYDEIQQAIEDLNEVQDYSYPRPMFVMPDIIGEQSASIDLVNKYKDYIKGDADFDLSIPIVPLQKGKLSLAEAYRKIVDIIGTNNFVVGLPSNESAISHDELRAFLKDIQPANVHFLGAAAPKKLTPLLHIVAQTSPNTKVTADASQIRSKILSNVKNGMERNEAITNALDDFTDPSWDEVFKHYDIRAGAFDNVRFEIAKDIKNGMDRFTAFNKAIDKYSPLKAAPSQNLLARRQVEEPKAKLSEEDQLKADAKAIEDMDPEVRENIAPHDMSGGTYAYNIYEAKVLLPKSSDKLKKITGDNSLTLWQEYEYIANVDGELYGITKQEDPDEPDDESRFVYYYNSLYEPYAHKPAWTDNKEELFAEIRKDQNDKKSPPADINNIPLNSIKRVKVDDDAHYQEMMARADKTRKEIIDEYAGLQRRKNTLGRKVAESGSTLEIQKELNDIYKLSDILKDIIKSTEPKNDSAEHFVAKAKKEFALGNISKDVMDVIEFINNKYPNLLEGLKLSVRMDKGSNSAGRYNAFEKLVTLFKGTEGVTDGETIRHELCHSLEQLMTPAARAALIDTWAKAFVGAEAKFTDGPSKEYFKKVKEFLKNPTIENYNAATNACHDVKNLYQFLNPSEYWAVNAEKLMAAKMGTPWARFVNAINKIYEGLKRFFGFNNNYDVHKVFEQVFNGTTTHDKNGALLVNYLFNNGTKLDFANNIKKDNDLMNEYGVPETPSHESESVKEMLVGKWGKIKTKYDQFKNQPKDEVADLAKVLGDTALAGRIKAVWFGAGLEAEEFKRYNGKIRNAFGEILPSVILKNAMKASYIYAEVIKLGHMQYDKVHENFMAKASKYSMGNVLRLQHELREKLGTALADKVINTYHAAKRARSMQNSYLDAIQKVQQLSDDIKATTDLDLKERLKTELVEAKQYLQSISRGYIQTPNYLCAIDPVNPVVTVDGKRVRNIMLDRDGMPILNDEAIDRFIAQDKKYPQLAEILKNFTSVNHNMLDMMAFSGRISKGMAEKLKAIKDYSPWTRIMDDAKEDLFGSRNLGVNTAGIKHFKLTRTERDLENVVDSMMHNVGSMIRSSTKTYAQVKIAREFATRRPDERDPKTGKMVRGKIRVYPTEGIDSNGVHFPIYANGRKVIVQIQNRAVGEAMIGLAMGPIEYEFQKTLASFSNFARRSVTFTGYFQAKQVFYDAPTAAWVSGVRNPFKLWGECFSSFANSVTGIATGMPDSATIQILKSAGIGGFQGYHRETSAEFKTKMGLFEGSAYSKAMNMIDRIGDASDFSQREAVYNRVLKESGDPALALLQANDIIDFSRHGNAKLAMGMRQTIPFMQAFATQMDAFTQAAQGKGFKGKTQGEAARQFYLKTGMMLAGVTLAYVFMCAQDDDYLKLDDDTRARNFYIPFSKKTFGYPVLIPMHSTASLFWKIMPELLINKLITEGTENEMDATRLWAALGRATMDSMMGPTPVPSLAKAPMEIMFDHNFYTGNRLTPRGLEGLDKAEQYNYNTSELGKFLSAATGHLLSPIQAEQLGRGWAGSMYAFGEWVSNEIFSEDRVAPSPRDNPFLGGFVGPEVSRRNENLFYGLKEKTEPAYNTYVAKLSKGDDQESINYYNKNKDLIQAHEYVSAVSNDLDSINKMIKLVGKSEATGPNGKAYTPEEKKRIITEYQETKSQLLMNIIEFRKQAGL